MAALAQNEMKAKDDMPLRVRLTEWLGVIRAPLLMTTIPEHAVG